eukprot:TRINITY_DN33804_c0_g1_i4.p3 TRINITY_DN33804_c0_g1~~TRINITY_DN33804_c0_g1_i4.p3  ORF type:complete len:109 (-),score=4.73 TRINITY_DN33804_c0_g1_i4:17-343(-)
MLSLVFVNLGLKFVQGFLSFLLSWDDVVCQRYCCRFIQYRMSLFLDTFQILSGLQSRLAVEGFFEQICSYGGKSDVFDCFGEVLMKAVGLQITNVNNETKRSEYFLLS